MNFNHKTTITIILISLEDIVGKIYAVQDPNLVEIYSLTKQNPNVNVLYKWNEKNIIPLIRSMLRTMEKVAELNKIH